MGGSLDLDLGNDEEFLAVAFLDLALHLGFGGA
jgi:hypothetical protein